MTDVSVFPEKSYVFVPEAEDMYVPAKVLTTFKRGEKGNVEIVDIQTKASQRNDKDSKKRTKNVTLTPDQSKGILPMDPESLLQMSNMVSLKQLNNGSILHNLRLRFMNDEIYTAIGTILVSVNPFKILPIYTPKLIDSFIEKGSAKNEPHVYGIADDSYKQMTRFFINQSCIVAGESGAGKTEATKVFLSYLAEISSRQEGNTTGSIQQQILEANPLMEAFGNAKTLRNDNSSRFGKWIAINFNNKRGQIIGGSITQYLLEKSRVVHLTMGERNYHIFYQMCATAQTDPAFGTEYKLQDPDFYNYLSPEETTTAVDSNEVVEN
jgi:myosin heavy subunit